MTRSKLQNIPCCMGCKKELTPLMVVAFWDPENRELVCNDCARTGRVLFRGPTPAQIMADMERRTNKLKGKNDPC